jgi:hypothetical protein
MSDVEEFPVFVSQANEPIGFFVLQFSVSVRSVFSVIQLSCAFLVSSSLPQQFAAKEPKDRRGFGFQVSNPGSVGPRWRHAMISPRTLATYLQTTPKSGRLMENLPSYC